jgi:hypothetical protein
MQKNDALHADTREHGNTLTNTRRMTNNTKKLQVDLETHARSLDLKPLFETLKASEPKNVDL